MSYPLQAHPFFNGVDWERLYSQRPPYTPVVAHELDTRNFENFEVRPLSVLCARFSARRATTRRLETNNLRSCAVLLWTCCSGRSSQSPADLDFAVLCPSPLKPTKVIVDTIHGNVRDSAR